VRTICITIVHIRCITCVNNISISVHCPLDVIIIPSVGIVNKIPTNANTADIDNNVADGNTCALFY